MIRKLIWKEWREQRWKLALGCVALVGFTLVGLRTRIVMDQVIILTGGVVAAFALPVFVGMDLVAQDRSTGSLKSLLKLPAPPRVVLLVKLAVGAVACVAPILAVAAVSCILAGGTEMSTARILQLNAGMAALSLVLLVWVTAFGVRQPTETRAGLVGLAVLFACWGIAGVYSDFLESRLPEWIIVLHPASLLVVVDEQHMHWLRAVIPVQAALAAALVCWTVSRFSRPWRCGR